MNKKLILPAFLVMVLAQLYVPMQMIIQSEQILTSGTAYKFKTAPIDPHDPFRGKYVQLSFEQDQFITSSAEDWASGEQVYVALTTDEEGFASITALWKRAPDSDEDYVLATVNYTSSDSIHTVYIDYPFDRYYMDEFKAPAAERVYNESVPDSTQIAYALVMVKKGQAVIQDVLINETSLKDLIQTDESQ